MQNFNHSGQQPTKQPNQQQPTPPKPQATDDLLTKVLTHLDVVGALIMLVAMFLGSFYKSDGGLYSAWTIPGYSLILNSNYMLGTLLIVLPAVVLIAKYVDALKKYDRLISLVCLVVTVIFVFVIKGQASTLQDGAIKFATGALVYLVGNVIGLAGAAAGFFGYDVNAKVNEVMKKK